MVMDGGRFTGSHRALIAGLAPEARQAVFRVATAIAQPDSQITNQEEQALAVVADALASRPGSQPHCHRQPLCRSGRAFPW